LFRKMCLPVNIVQCINKVETMPAAWQLLDAFCKNLLAFIKDLMQDIQTVHKL
jgi:hypothetical protein